MAEPGLYTSHIIGPIHSRRLGVSLGVNLLPTDGKVCSFDCVYCECGWNADHRGGKLPQADEVEQQLAARLKEMHDRGEHLDVITFAGNGEPTLHPDFARVIDRTIALRDEYFPEVKVSVLSNATRMTNAAVQAALMRVDNNILKLDGAFDETVRLIDQPQDAHYSVQAVVEGMKSYGGQLTVQTMFVRGEHNGRSFDNTTPEEVEAWRQLIRQIAPHQVMVYSLDRPTPEKNLTAVSKAEMEEIVKPLVEEGFSISVSGK